MQQEIERKFLVKTDSWRAAADEGTACRQGYLCAGPGETTCRVRLMGEKGFLTIKGPAQGISRPEMEYDIPAEDAEYMLAHLCAGGTVSKTRYRLVHAGATWEIDEFSGENSGLVLAEIELESEEQPVEKPEWLGEEVSLDRRYTNASLARTPIMSGRPQQF
jgi:adenylate cyclase